MSDVENQSSAAVPAEYIREIHLTSEQSEQALMGAVSFYPDACASVLASLSGDDFYVPGRGLVWDACRQLSADREPITSVTISRMLAEAGAWNEVTKAVLSREMSVAAPAHQAPRHAHIVADLARRRELLRMVGAARSLVVEPDSDASEILARIRASFDEAAPTDREHSGTRTWAQMAAEFEQVHDPANVRKGIATPWKELNSLIGGLFGGRLYVIGGSAGDGKSTVALNIAASAAYAGQKVLVFSKEMPAVDVFARIVSAPTETELGEINRRELSEFQRAKVMRFARNHPLPIRVNADQVNMAAIKSICRALHHRGELDLLVVDYLQLIDTGANARSQEEEIAKVSTAMKLLAMELDVPLVIPAQLNRNPHAKADGRPTKADLRGSGRIEQDADVVILLWHETIDGIRTGDVTFILDKHRHGPRGEFKLEFNGGYGAIGQLERPA